jgi:hypothetical protein
VPSDQEAKDQFLYVKNTVNELVTTTRSSLDASISLLKSQRRRNATVLISLSVLFVLILGITGTSLFTIYKVRDSISCQSRVNEQLRIALSERSNTASLDRENLSQFFKEFYSDPDNKAAGQRALVNYLSRQAENERVRVDLPSPAGSCDVE